MAWTYKNTKVEVSEEVKVGFDISHCKPDQLLQALVDNEIVSAGEAEQLLARSDENPFEVDLRFMIDANELETARADLFSGRRAEALIHLERALGGDFVGRLAVA